MAISPTGSFDPEEPGFWGSIGFGLFCSFGMLFFMNKYYVEGEEKK